MPGTYAFAFSSLAPSALVTGLPVEATKRYRPQLRIGWTIVVIGFGLMSTITATDSLGISVGYLVILGLDGGILNVPSVYPIKAPSSVTQNAPELAFMWFLSSFVGVWGIAIGGAVVQNELAKKLPASFIQSVPQGTAIIPTTASEPNKANPTYHSCCIWISQGAGAFQKRDTRRRQHWSRSRTPRSFVWTGEW
ncbi:hypothetical protein V8E55_012193 [Tylopilus felleus]